MQVAYIIRIICNSLDTKSWVGASFSTIANMTLSSETPFFPFYCQIIFMASAQETLQRRHNNSWTGNSWCQLIAILAHNIHFLIIPYSISHSISQPRIYYYLIFSYFFLEKELYNDKSYRFWSFFAYLECLTWLFPV